MSSFDLQAGAELHGFTLTGSTRLPEINANLIQLRHGRTGARMVHLETADDNNLFGVAFRTTPLDNTGVAHILEHTVLCGSERYPVRDPFFTMIKRSLNTFMNALTSSDWTLYPFSSQNEKDFYNLMDVYLDAAFFPLLRERDFRQEGHRLEFSDPNDPSSPLTFKGVVYNEMKGAMADPSSLIYRRMAKALYPTTTYGYNSGGEPLEILDLTWQQLRDFHALYYHPSNAWFFTCGTFSLEKHLQTIEERVLSRFESRDVPSAVPEEKRFEAPKQVTETFPIDAGEPLQRRSMVQIAWLATPVTDSFERLAMTVLSQLLLGNPAAPLYKALLDSKLGQNLAPGTGYHDDNRETYFAAGLQGTEPESAGAVEDVVIRTLEKCARDGFPRERIEAAIHQLEFSNREVSGDQYPYPLLLLMRMMGPWLHSDDPVTPLRLAANFDRLRKELDEGPFFETLIRLRLLENRHRVTLTLRPDPAHGEREEKETAERLERLVSALSENEREAILQQGKELQEAQEAVEDVSILPTVELSDIPASEREIRFDRQDKGSVPLFLFDQPTNGIGYFSAGLQADDIPEDLRSYVSLLTSVLTHIGAAGYGYEEMAERISASTGGIRAGTSILDHPGNLDGFQTIFEIKGKSLIRNHEKMFGILNDIFTAPDFTDLNRLRTVIGQIKISLENSIPASGHSFASRAAASGLTPAARQREQWGGLQQVRLVREAAAMGDEELSALAERLRQLGEFLLCRERVRAAFTAERPNIETSRPALENFLEALPGKSMGKGASSVPFSPQRIVAGWATSVPVSYVARVFRTVPFTHPDSAALMILARLLRASFLHREIREKGGAYGGMASFDPESGIFSMLSYRDPHLARTLRVYREAAEWASAGKFADSDIKEAILAVFSSLDRPLSPGGRGNREFANQLQGLTRQMRQELREKVLAADRATLSSTAERYFMSGWEESAVGVISSEEALRRANDELPEGEKLKIEKI
jgi:presequence protease